jgi:tight adherence protein C
VIVASAMAASSLPLLWWALATTRTPPTTAALNLRRGLSDRLGPTPDLREVLLAQSAAERALLPAAMRLANLARALTPAGMVRNLEHRVELAGVGARWPAERILSAKLLLGGGGALLGLWVALSSPGLMGLLFFAFLTALGYFAPDTALSHLGAARRLRISRDLPDTLDQVTICVEAGLGFEAALSRVAFTGEGPLAEELRRTLQDLQLGLSRSEALRRMSDRSSVAELRHFVMAVVQAEVYGVPIATILRVQAGELREKRRQKAEETAMKIPVKVVFPLVLCILPTIFILVIGPAVIRIAGNGGIAG